MVIAGKIRGNASQLASYLLAMGNNERISIIDVDGRNDASASCLKDMLYSMELNSELTRSPNSVYHAYINPNPDDTSDRAMTMAEWQQSVDILTKELGYEDQRRVVVLHEKPGARVHAHIVYERYNHDSGVMATYEHNFKAHDRARAEMEIVLNHTPTPQKNKNCDSHKQTLTELWQRTNTAQEFIREAEVNGYKIAKGTDRPFKVIDTDGISFDLVRKLDGVKTKEVKTRFAETELITEKEAIREQQAAKQERLKQQLAPEAIVAAQPQKVQVIDEREELRRKFLEQVKDVRERNRSVTPEITFLLFVAMRASMFNDTTVQSHTMLKQQFVYCSHIITASDNQKPPEKMLGFIEAAQFYKPT